MYSQPTFTIDAGQLATFQNTTPGFMHSMTAATNGPDGQHLFNSGVTASGSQSSVNGTQYLAPGTYHFFCLIHGPSMSANLVVTGNGTPVARPQVSLKVLSSKLAKVASSGKLKLKISAASESSGVSVAARKGVKTLGSSKNIALAAGATRVVKMSLSGAGRKALTNLHSAKIKVTAAVPFGSPATAKRTLH